MASAVLLLFFFTIFFLSLSNGVNSQPLAHACNPTTTYSPNSAYRANLNFLLSNLSSNGSFDAGFSSFIAGGGSTNTVYGRFLCRGDFITEDCRECVGKATIEIIQLCRNETTAVVWYDNCLLQFSDQSTSSMSHELPKVFNSGNWNITDTYKFQFRGVLGKLMVGITRLAANNPSGKKFATKEMRLTAHQKLYGLVQCMPDLSSDDCISCLTNLIVNLRSLPIFCDGAMLYSPSCNFRYEVYPFYRPVFFLPPTIKPFYRPRPRPPAPAPPPLPPAPPLPPRAQGGKTNRATIIITSPVVVLTILTLVGCCIYFAIRKRARKEKKGIKQKLQYLDLMGEDFHGENQLNSQELPLVPLDHIEAATERFSEKNKLGEGGFGPVYKGTLSDGKEIAVKRLSRTSGQGLQEFKNEVTVIARLQHRNLVRLLGCCLEANESLLIYEFMPNKSLDFFLFDSSKRVQLNWKRRLEIIKGVARGLMYLHEDSRLRIIHRDLKTSNILLDHEMNPKISDFGMARIFGGNQREANTNRVVGTYGYMAPEYAMEGLFSIKSDVFSFGVLLLEIVSGRKNGSFYLSEYSRSLLAFAWNLWSEGRVVEFMDPTIAEADVVDGAVKCVHIGLLCVQEDPMDRPTMSYVIHMLGSDTISLPTPRQPAFYVRRIATKSTEYSQDTQSCSINEITLSDVAGR